MFTQTKKLNISRCNGCNRKCTLGAKTVIFYDNYSCFVPTINNQIQRSYIDRQGKKRLVQQYINPAVAISFARTISKLCPHYTRPPQPTPSAHTNTQCNGCENKCILGTKRVVSATRDGFLPVIGTQEIRKYTDKRGLNKIVPHYNDPMRAQIRADKISKLCDHYQR